MKFLRQEARWVRAYLRAGRPGPEARAERRRMKPTVEALKKVRASWLAVARTRREQRAWLKRTGKPFGHRAFGAYRP